MQATAPHLRSVIDQDGAVILDVQRDTMLTLNSTGAYIWQRLQQGKLIDEIIRDLAQDSGVDLNVVDRDVHDFLEQLKSKHLLREQERNHPQAYSVTRCFDERLHEYRVLLVLPATRQILVSNDCGTLRLPHLTIPKWTRPAETLTEAIDEKWHISSAVIDFFIGDADQPPCAVIEVRQAGRQCPELDPISVEADTAGISNLSDRERDTVRDILRVIADRGVHSRALAG